MTPKESASYLVVVPDQPIIAPSAFKHDPNRAALILEVGYIEGDVAIVIVHAMIAREKFLR